jgi:hypothetical protein
MRSGRARRACSGDLPALCLFSLSLGCMFMTGAQSKTSLGDEIFLAGLPGSYPAFETTLAAARASPRSSDTPRRDQERALSGAKTRKQTSPGADIGQQGSGALVQASFLPVSLPKGWPGFPGSVWIAGACEDGTLFVFGTSDRVDGKQSGLLTKYSPLSGSWEQVEGLIGAGIMGAVRGLADDGPVGGRGWIVSGLFWASPNHPNTPLAGLGFCHDDGNCESFVDKEGYLILANSTTTHVLAVDVVKDPGVFFTTVDLSVGAGTRWTTFAVNIDLFATSKPPVPIISIVTSDPFMAVTMLAVKADGGRCAMFTYSQQLPINVQLASGTSWCDTNQKDGLRMFEVGVWSFILQANGCWRAVEHPELFGSYQAGAIPFVVSSQHAPSLGTFTSCDPATGAARVFVIEIVGSGQNITATTKNVTYDLPDVMSRNWDSTTCGNLTAIVKNKGEYVFSYQRTAIMPSAYVAVTAPWGRVYLLKHGTTTWIEQNLTCSTAAARLGMPLPVSKDRLAALCEVNRDALSMFRPVSSISAVYTAVGASEAPTLVPDHVSPVANIELARNVIGLMTSSSVVAFVSNSYAGNSLCVVNSEMSDDDGGQWMLFETARVALLGMTDRGWAARNPYQRAGQVVGELQLPTNESRCQLLGGVGHASPVVDLKQIGRANGGELNVGQINVQSQMEMGAVCPTMDVTAMVRTDLCVSAEDPRTGNRTTFSSGNVLVVATTRLLSSLDAKIFFYAVDLDSKEPSSSLNRVIKLRPHINGTLLFASLYVVAEDPDLTRSRRGFLSICETKKTLMLVGTLQVLGLVFFLLTLFSCQGCWMSERPALWF